MGKQASARSWAGLPLFVLGGSQRRDPEYDSFDEKASLRPAAFGSPRTLR